MVTHPKNHGFQAKKLLVEKGLLFSFHAARWCFFYLAAKPERNPENMPELEHVNHHMLYLEVQDT